MKPYLLPILMVINTLICSSQECPSLINPAPNAIDVPVDVRLEWTEIAGATGYIISIGTTPNGTDIVYEVPVGSVNHYQTPAGLPESTTLYVTITLFFFNRPNITCESIHFTTMNVTTPPPCTMILAPADGISDVNVSTPITWNYAPTATGYRIAMGTTPDASNIVYNLDIGNTLSYKPDDDLPFLTTIYVRITPYNENGSPSGPCTLFQFLTGDAQILPGCTQLLHPYNGEVNVALSPKLEWNPVPNADGYRVSMGYSPYEPDILDNVEFRNTNTYVLEFEPNKTIFVQIVPFNSSGEALGCTQESFFTYVGCGDHYSDTGELIQPRPEIKFPDEIKICPDQTENNISASDSADGFRWYMISNGNEILISETKEVRPTASGQYIYEAYNVINNSEGSFECARRKAFSVIVSESPQITSITVNENGTSVELTIKVAGNGTYEYALDNINGPYQDNNIFTNVDYNGHVAYVRDKNGCGNAEKFIDLSVDVGGFPKFFTPNGDGINDFWQYRKLSDSSDLNVTRIFIYNRFGSFLGEIDPKSQGWGGNFNGKPLPTNNYWFKAVTSDEKEIKGYFVLKR